jgi:outer membrane biosynthesis protein TonB
VTHITLREIVTGQTALQWTEAVAIVQGVCVEAARLAGIGRPAIPADSDVRLTRDGLIEFTAAGDPRESPVHQAGALLALLLPPGSTPVPLRLEAVAAVGPTPHRSLGEFSAALAPFERPNGPEILRAAYARLVDGLGLELPPVPPVTVAPGPPSVPDPFPVRPSAPPAVVSWSSRDALASFESESSSSAERLIHRQVARWQGLVDRTRAVGWQWVAPAVAGGCVVGIVAAAAWWVTPHVTAHPAPAVTTARVTTPPVKPAPSQATSDAAVAAAPADAAAPLVPQPVAASPVIRPPQPSTPHPVASAKPPRAQGRAVPPLPTASMTDPSATVPLGRPATAAVRPAPPKSAGAAPEADPQRPAQATPRGTDQVDEVIYLSPEATAPTAADPSAPVYSPADKDVRRPVGIRPRFWYDPPPGIPVDTLTQIQVIVTAAGEVESAKVVGGPRSYFDGMFLSAIKAWRFQPATKDGKPVSYRQTIWLLVETAR